MVLRTKEQLFIDICFDVHYLEKKETSLIGQSIQLLTTDVLSISCILTSPGRGGARGE